MALLYASADTPGKEEDGGVEEWSVAKPEFRLDLQICGARN